MGHALIKEFCELDAECQRLMQVAHDRFKYSARSYYKYLKVARTFADLDDAASIRKKDVASALMARDLEKEKAGMMVI
jgi:magnesium chelatase family protein